ncbi:OpgC domain-containing protein [Pseudooceanicola sp. 216_PA32_1]|uniref:OpgC domain-containing protein n=1 Tax=Pseudooceanicola pacificus TaxID=2676438 RepID=A0A844VYX4_9RHOB|nr:OpgC domain-containing protein [Pseudooceanicola pacificus]MWB76587.1 OpgC domain-containing protein [Pseudooceanicola pacificus]
MPQPDPTLVAFPAAQPPVKPPRDLRIDMFRGLALVMIFVDHVPGNPYEAFTSRNFGFSDAAEAFFVMSGIAAGIAYSGRFLPDTLRRNGHWAAISPIWARAWTLYLVHVFLTAWAIAIFAWGASTFVLPELRQAINLRQVFENTGPALAGVPALTHQLGYVNILPAYAVLLVCLPAAIVLGLRRPWTLALLSALLWYAAGHFRLNLPNYPNPGGWFFNPFSWQVVFVTGLLIGLALRRGERLVPRSPWLFWPALAFVVLVLVWVRVPAVAEVLNTGMAWLGAQGAPFHIVAHDKTFVSLPRLLHILALVYVISSLGWVRSLSGSRIAAPLRLMGRQGLLVFSLGTVLALTFQVMMAAEPDLSALPWVLPAAGVGLMLAAAWLREEARRRMPRPVGKGQVARPVAPVSRAAAVPAE